MCIQKSLELLSRRVGLHVVQVLEPERPETGELVVVVMSVRTSITVPTKNVIFFRTRKNQRF